MIVFQNGKNGQKRKMFCIDTVFDLRYNQDSSGERSTNEYES